MSGDFINIPDVGKLIEVSSHLRSLYEKRANVLNKRMMEVPDYKDSVTHLRQYPTPVSMLEFAAANNIPEVSLNALASSLFSAANEHEDISKMLLDIFTRISLYKGVELAAHRDKLKESLERINMSRVNAIKSNEQLKDISKSQSREFSRKITENVDLLETRKLKFIRSLKKAIEVAGPEQAFSESDEKVFKHLFLIGWVEKENGKYICNEEAIFKSDYDMSKRVFTTVKTVIINHYQSEEV